MVHVPKAFEPERHKLPIETDHTREVAGPSPYPHGPAPPSAVQRDAIQGTGPGPTRYPQMPIPDNTPLRIGTIEEPQNFVTARSRRTDMLNMMNPTPVTSSELRTRLAHTLNAVSAENGSDTPDFILAEYLMGCLRAFDLATTERDRWYGRGGPVAEVMAEAPSDPNANQAIPEENDFA